LARVPKARRWRRVRTRRVAAATLAAVLVAAAAAVWLAPSGANNEPTRSEAPRVVANSLVRLDPTTGRVTSTVRVGATPVSIAKTPGALWIVNRADRTVSRYDLRTHDVRTIGGVPFAYDVAADAAGEVWVSSSSRAIVTRITSGVSTFPEQPAASESIAVPFYAGVETVGGGYLWVTNAGGGGFTGPSVVGENLVSTIDLRTHKVSSIKLGQVPTAIAFGFGSVWIGTFDPKTSTESIVVIRPGSNHADSIRLDSLASWGVHDIAVGAGSVWALTWLGTLVRIDPETRGIRARIPIGSDKEPLGVAVGAGSVWVTNRGDLSVARIDRRTNRVAQTIPLGEVGAFPCGVAATADAVWVTIGPDTDCASPQTR
jgi:hypothetical protein